MVASVHNPAPRLSADEERDSSYWAVTGEGCAKAMGWASRFAGPW